MRTKLDTTDKKLLSIAAILLIVSGLFFIQIKDTNLFFYLFGSVLLLIFSLVSIVMAGLAYSIGKETGDIAFTGKNGLVDHFCEMSSKDGTYLIGVIILLIGIIFASNFVSYILFPA